MRIRILSDLHLEFEELELPRVDCDVAVLAGDIHIGTRAVAWMREQLPDCPVLYVPGNHEFYRANLSILPAKLRAACDAHGISLLDRDVVVIGNVRFLGTTLWTDYRIGGRQGGTMWEVERRMTDHRLIRFGPHYRKVKPGDLLAIHEQARAWLAAELVRPFAGKTVVISHHAPSPRCLPGDTGADPLSGAYASDLEAMMAGVDLWIHGHLHASCDFLVGDTRVVCNPRGYAPFELNEAFLPDLVVTP